MAPIDFQTLEGYAKSFSGLTPERERLLIQIGPDISPSLPRVTDAFYQTLAGIPAAAAFLEGRLEPLKQTHLLWLDTLFVGPFDLAYVKTLYRVGHVHVKVNLPVEFMAGGITLIGGRLMEEIEHLYPDDLGLRRNAHGAVNSILGFSLFIMQKSYQSASLHAELEKFLKITGISRMLFNNLAAAYDN